MRAVPIKNYLFLGLLSVVTVLVVLYMANWYKASKEYYLESSVMTNFLGEIKETELENYILENPEVVIYISSDAEDTTKKFEKKLKDYIIKEEIASHFIYLNCSNVSTDFMDRFQKKYFKGSLQNVYLPYPNLLIVHDKQVVDILYKLNQTPDIKDAERFLKKNGVVGDA